MTQQIGLPELPEPLTCVDSGNRPWCLAGQKLPSFGKGGCREHSVPTFAVSFPGSRFSYTQLQKFPVQARQCPSVAVTLSEAPRCLLCWILTVSVLEQW